MHHLNIPGIGLARRVCRRRKFESILLSLVGAVRLLMLTAAYREGSDWK